MNQLHDEISAHLADGNQQYFLVHARRFCEELLLENKALTDEQAFIKQQRDQMRRELEAVKEALAIAKDTLTVLRDHSKDATDAFIAKVTLLRIQEKESAT